MGCKTDPEITAVIDDINVNIALPNYYFDVNRFETPVSISGLRTGQYGFISGMYLKQVIHLQVNEAETYDNFLGDIWSDTYQYISYERYDSSILNPSSASDLMGIQIVLDPKYSKVERKVYTLFDVLGQIGGVMGIIIPLFVASIQFFSTKIYTMTMLSLLYQVDEKPDYKVVPIESQISNMDKSQVIRMSYILFRLERSLKEKYLHLKLTFITKKWNEILKRKTNYNLLL